jgi:hypothetical protein
VQGRRGQKHASSAESQRTANRIRAPTTIRRQFKSLPIMIESVLAGFSRINLRQKFEAKSRKID